MSKTLSGKDHAPGRPGSAAASRVDAHIESLLDEALAATFPASDPVSTLTLDEPSRSRSETAGALSGDHRPAR